MTKQEQQTIRNIIARLKKPRAGCAEPIQDENAQAGDYEGVSRIYIDTWLIGPLECLLLSGWGGYATNVKEVFVS